VLRHGDRTPSNDGDESFPTDPYVNDSFFPTGVGQLTNVNNVTLFYFTLIFFLKENDIVKTMN